MKTVGISPKAVGAVVMAVGGYLVVQELVAFPAWVELLIMVALVGAGAFVPGPGTVRAGAPRGWRNERGVGAIDALIIVFLAVVILIVLDRLL